MEVRYVYKGMSGSLKSRMCINTTVRDKLRSIIGLLVEEIKSDYGASCKKKKEDRKREDCSGVRASWE